MNIEQYPPRERRSDLEWSDKPPTTEAELDAINTPTGPEPIVGGEIEPYEEN